jgi:hypothetical protein
MIVIKVISGNFCRLGVLASPISKKKMERINLSQNIFLDKAKALDSSGNSTSRKSIFASLLAKIS